MTVSDTIISGTDADYSDVAGELDRIRLVLRRNDFEEALRRARSLAVRAPRERDALLFLAIAHRRLGRTREALGILQELEENHPNFSRQYEERGFCHVAMRQGAEAIEAFCKALALNAALPASWSMLQNLYRMEGRTADAASATAQLDALGRIPAPVVAAISQFLDGDLLAAEARVREFLTQHGNHVEAMRLLARIGIARKVFDDAELLLAAVLELTPDYRTARLEYAEVLIELHREADACRELEQLMQEDPAHRLDYQGLYATACVGLGQHERAIELYRELLRGTSLDADTHLSIAHAQKTIGDREAAVESYRRAAAARAGFGDAYWSLANLKTFRFSSDEIRQMKAMECDAALPTIDRLHMCFALGKALEDQGDFAESFLFYERGNALKHAVSGYDPKLIEDNTARQRATCTARFFADRRAYGVPDQSPIFIVGLPRSGSTLIEQILASHSSVEGTQELPHIQQTVATLRGRDPDPRQPRYPRVLADMSPEDFRELGRRYLDNTRVYRSSKPLFIDKMPNNFRHLGLIRLILPNARIIDARRSPMACCFSNFKQLFARGQEFTYSLEDIARYYRTYLDLMRHWNEVLPGWILRVQHEDLVDDLEFNVRRILEFCGLPFERQCLEFHKTARSVRTASSEQVRQPLYRDGLDQWKNFEPWLQPLMDALGDAHFRYRDQ
jgi:tetratricopeptide (TPR) repeat protein